MDARFALSWEFRENNPELVQEKGPTRSRTSHEKEDLERDLKDVEGNKPSGRVVSMQALFEKAGWQRKMRKSRERRARTVRHKGRRGSLGKLPAAVGLTNLKQSRRQRGRGLEDPYMGQYDVYTFKRDKMEDEGFWDEDKTKTAEDTFGFIKDEQELSKEPELDEGSEEETDGGSEDIDQFNSVHEGDATEKKRKKSGKRVVISSVPPHSTTLHDSEDTGIDTSSSSRDSTQSEINMDGKWRRSEDVEDDLVESGRLSRKGRHKKGAETEVRPTSGIRDGATPSEIGTPATYGRGTSGQQPDLMSRFYARLQELQEAKQEDDQTTTTTSDAYFRNRDRRRIKTALRRLLADRLFSEEAKSKRTKTLGKVNQGYDVTEDGLESGTITPLTLGSRTKTAMSTRSRLDVSTRATTGMGSQGRVMFVGEHSQVATSEGQDKPSTWQGGDTTLTEAKTEEGVPYYRRHPLGTLRQGKVSRLYQPPAMTHRSRTSLSQSSLQQGLHKDKAFLQRMKGDNGLRAETRWSVPGEYPPDRGRDERLQPEYSRWRREKTEVAWTYNMAHHQGDDKEVDEENHEEDQERQHTARLNLRSLDDWHLRKLLEELYRDKKYMDRMINSAENEDKEELEMSTKMEGGRDYLLDRALYWMERGPLPPRPPTTDLGYRLQKMRAQTSSQTGGQTPLPNRTPVPPSSRQHCSREKSHFSTTSKSNDSRHDNSESKTHDNSESKTHDNSESKTHDNSESKTQDNGESKTHKGTNDTSVEDVADKKSDNENHTNKKDVSDEQSDNEKNVDNENGSEHSNTQEEPYQERSESENTREQASKDETHESNDNNHESKDNIETKPKQSDSENVTHDVPVLPADTATNVYREVSSRAS